MLINQRPVAAGREMRTSIHHQKHFTSALRPVAPIQPDGTGLPLFLVGPGLEGLGLARGLGTNRPLYGVRVPNLELEPLPHTIEDIAAECVRGLLRVRPQGPYALCGWCAAGVLALEMAHQLEKQGQEVAFVALFDARTIFLPEMSVGRRILVRSWQFVQRLTFFVSQLRIQGLKVLRATISDRLTRARDARTRARRGLAPSHNHLLYAALHNYRPRPWSGRIIHIWAAERPRGWFRDPEFSWSHLSPRGFVFHEVPGDHHSIMAEPDIAAVSAILASELDAVAEPARINQHG